MTDLTPEEEALKAEEEDSHWEPRPDVWMINVFVTGDEELANYRDFNLWMDRLCATIGSTRDASMYDDKGEPWAVGSHQDYGWWDSDHMTGLKILRKTPRAWVWQKIEGVPSKALALVWAAMHLVLKLEEAGFNAADVSVTLSDTMVVVD